MTRSSSFGRSVLGMGAANFISYALQMAVPLVLVRVFSAEDFAAYRMIWLVEATVMAFATFGVPQSLSFFLPRHSDSSVRREYVGAALSISLVAATGVAILMCPWLPIVDFIPLKGAVSGWFFSAFLFVWLLGVLIEWLPIGDGRAGWQARVIALLAVARASGVVFAAIHFGTMGAVLVALLGFALLRVAILILYVRAHYAGLGTAPFGRLREVAGYSAPIGFANGLYVMRQQAELWVVSAICTATQFAAFSIAAMPSGLFSIMRATVNNVAFPRISLLKERGQNELLAEANRDATALVSFALLPSIAFLYLMADHIVVLLFTEAYADAASVMRVYLAGAAFLVFDGNMLLRVFSQGSFLLIANVVSLVLVVPASVLGYMVFGLPGAAVGSSVVLICNQVTISAVAARLLSVSVLDMFALRKMAGYLSAALVAAFLLNALLGYSDQAMKAVWILVSGVVYASAYLLICAAFRGLPVSWRK